MTFEKIDGPEWLRVRGQELMTNFGPSNIDLGINKVTVLARDTQGASLKFVVPISVQKKNSKEINLLPFKAEVKGPKKGEKSLYHFKQVGHQATWKEFIPANTYKVILVYKCSKETATSQVSLSSQNLELTAALKETPFQAKTLQLGKMKISSSGLRSFKLAVKSKSHDKMNLEVIRIVLTVLK